MAVRVDRSAAFGTRPMDGASGSGYAGSVPNGFTGEPDPYGDRPGQLRPEYLVSNSLRAATVSSRYIEQLRPPVPQQLLPPRFGYSHEALTIEDVLATNRWSADWRRWVSGAAIVRKPDNAVPVSRYYDEDFWSGTLRNVNGAIAP
jgi:hypothetical protein